MKKFKINSGNVGAILNILSYVLGGFTALIGGILILNKLKELSEKFNDYSILKYYIIAYVINISSFIVFIYYLNNIFTKFNGNLNNININEIYLIFIIFLIFYIVIIIGTYFIKKSYLNLSKYIDNPTINKIGNLYFYGAILFPIGVGLIMVIIAQFLEIKLYTDINN